MKKIIRNTLTGLAFAAATQFSAGIALAADAAGGNAYITQSSQSNFSDAVVDLENAVINRGLVIDYKGLVGDMLSRTGEAVGVASPYSDAIYMHFCSAKHTHAAVAADPENMAICPYIVFAYELKADPGKVTLGYRLPKGAATPASQSAMAGIDALLKGIVDEAAE